MSNYRKNEAEPVEPKPMGWRLRVRGIFEMGGATSSVAFVSAFSGLLLVMALATAYIAGYATPEAWRGMHVMAVLFFAGLPSWLKLERK